LQAFHQCLIGKAAVVPTVFPTKPAAAIKLIWRSLTPPIGLHWRCLGKLDYKLKDGQKSLFLSPPLCTLIRKHFHTHLGFDASKIKFNTPAFLVQLGKLTFVVCHRTKSAMMYTVTLTEL